MKRGTPKEVYLRDTLFWLASGRTPEQIEEETEKLGNKISADYVRRIMSEMEAGQHLEEYARAEKRYKDVTKVFPFSQAANRLRRLHELLTFTREARVNSNTANRNIPDFVRQERELLKDIDRESKGGNLLDSLTLIKAADFQAKKKMLVELMVKCIGKQALKEEDFLVLVKAAEEARIYNYKREVAFEPRPPRSDADPVQN